MHRPQVEEDGQDPGTAVFFQAVPPTSCVTQDKSLSLSGPLLLASRLGLEPCPALNFEAVPVVTVLSARRATCAGGAPNRQLVTRTVSLTPNPGPRIFPDKKRMAQR